MNALKALPGGLPNLHVAVVSSSPGAGIFDNVNGCMPLSPGDRDGAFQHSSTCAGLTAGETFIKASQDAAANNFSGDISAVFSCMALLGQYGCGFEQQFESVRRALQRAQVSPPDPENGGGFLRSNALLVIVMLTNEDDCSVPAASTLFDPSQVLATDPLGGLNSYRCNEFGHLCNGQPPPHDPSASPVALENCVSAEGGGPLTTPGHRLTTVGEFVDFLKGLKPGRPDSIVVAAIAGPVAPYVVGSRNFVLDTSAIQVVASMEHSCTRMVAAGGSPEYADPGIRIKQWIDAFGTNGLLSSICADDFQSALADIAAAIATKIGP